jgi:hypothetical protein
MDDGIQVTEQAINRNTISSRPMFFHMIGDANWVAHRHTTSNHP